MILDQQDILNLVCGQMTDSIVGVYAPFENSLCEKLESDTEIERYYMFSVSTVTPENFPKMYSYITDAIVSDYDGVTHDYTRKHGLIWERIFLPRQAPVEWEDRSALWNAVEAAEKMGDSRLARRSSSRFPWRQRAMSGRRY